MVMRGEGTYEHLDESYRRYAALPDEERIAWIKADRWIGSSRRRRHSSA